MPMLGWESEKFTGMNDQVPSEKTTPAKPASKAVEPRTHVNSSMSLPYVPSKGAPIRSGADHHRLHPTKGNPT